MRTSISLGVELVTSAQRLSGIRSKREVVEQALRTFIRVHEQTRVRALRGKLRWEDDLSAQREDHEQYHVGASPQRPGRAQRP